MKILVVGSGGREHALVWKLRKSKKIKKIFCIPGNAGIAQIAKCIDMDLDNLKALSDFAHRNKIGLTVVGPEAPLASGIVDEFQRRRLRIFGPTQKAAQLESSKVFAKEFMRKYHSYEGIDAYCPECDRIYCWNHYKLEEEWDEGFYDCTYGECPKGHKRMIDD